MLVTKLVEGVLPSLDEKFCLILLFIFIQLKLLSFFGDEGENYVNPMHFSQASWI